MLPSDDRKNFTQRRATTQAVVKQRGIECGQRLHVDDVVRNRNSDDNNEKHRDQDAQKNECAVIGRPGMQPLGPAGGRSARSSDQKSGGRQNQKAHE